MYTYSYTTIFHLMYDTYMYMYVKIKYRNITKHSEYVQERISYVYLKSCPCLMPINRMFFALNPFTQRTQIIPHIPRSFVGSPCEQKPPMAL